MLGKDKFDAAVGAVLAQWQLLLETLRASYPDWLLEVPSSAEQETYTWTNLIGQMREWIGERVLNMIRVQDYVLKNKAFEFTMAEKLENIERDKLGMLLPQVNVLYQTALTHPEMLVYQAMLLAYTTTCYDGQLFADTDHPTLDESTTFSNLTTASLGYDPVWDGMQHFATLQGANGQPLMLEPYLLWVGPNRQKIAAELITKERNAAGASNTLLNALQIKVNPLFVGDYVEYWQIWARPRQGSLVPAKPITDPNSPRPPVISPVTPFFVQMEKKAELTCTAANGQSVFGMQWKDLLQFMKNLVAFGADYRGNVGFTLPHLLYASNGTNV